MMKKVWIENESHSLNYTAGFLCEIPQTKGSSFLNVAGASAFRIFLNGKLIGYGPRRSAHGYSIINRYDITKYLSEGNIFIAVEVAGYNNNSFNLVMDKPFFCAEVTVNGNIIADTFNFEAYRITPRVQKCERYSFQRNFAEVYKYLQNPQDFYLGKKIYPKVNTAEVEGNCLIDAVLPYSSFQELEFSGIIEHGNVSVQDKGYYNTNAQYAQINNNVIAFPYDSIEVNLSSEAGALKYHKLGGEATGFLNNAYNLYDLKENKTGFIYLNLRANTDADIYLLFDEIIYAEAAKIPELAPYYGGEELPLVFFRSGTLNAVKFSLKNG